MLVLLITLLVGGCSITQPEPAVGTVQVNADLDGSPWTGPVGFTVTGQATGASVPATYTDAPVGSYTLTYLSGGPPEAAFVGNTPSGPQTLSNGGTITFTLDFRTKEVARSNVVVLATVRQADGAISWLGPVNFTLIGPETISGVSVPHPYRGMPLGDYRLEYVSGGPPGTAFLGVTPSTTQALSAGDTLTFTMEFG